METTTKIYDIYFDKNLDTVIMEWNGYANSAQFREGTEFMLNTLIQNNCPRVLADLNSMELIGMEDQQWLEKNFLPRAIQFGFKSIAIVKPKSYFSKVSVESVSYKIEKEKLEVNFFESFEEATKWLITT